ncbi:MAG: hypothetical protein JOY96_00110 [Verrucomicrobia bacterium]|nr:hypothetical protein [Verrucomicrobiota bacterium]
MSIIKAKVTRNQRETPSDASFDVWNIEAAFQEPIQLQEIEIKVDPQEIKARIVGPLRLDCTSTIVTIRTEGRSPVREGDTIHIFVEEFEKTVPVYSEHGA